jgi:hypothetical protein
MLLLLTTGEPGPPPALIPVTAVVPVRPVIEMLLFETVSATSDGLPEVNWKVTVVPVAATRSTLIVLF